MSFHAAILNAARNWNDNTLTRMPGVRERVVHIYLDSKKEGGLNLDMDPPTIKNWLSGVKWQRKKSLIATLAITP